MFSSTEEVISGIPVPTRSETLTPIIVALQRVKLIDLTTLAAERARRTSFELRILDVTNYKLRTTVGRVLFNDCRCPTDCRSSTACSGRRGSNRSFTTCYLRHGIQHATVDIAGRSVEGTRLPLRHARGRFDGSLDDMVDFRPEKAKVLVDKARTPGADQRRDSSSSTA